MNNVSRNKYTGKFRVLFVMAAVLLLCGAAFAGAASADYVEVTTWDELVEKASGWTKTDEMRTIVVMNDVVNGTGIPGDYGGISVTGNITIMPADTGSEIKIDANQMGCLFDVYGTLTLAGNSSTVLNVTGGNRLYASCGGVQVNGGGNLMLAENAKITNCSTGEGGGGVWVGGSGSFTMTGGSIEGCSAGSSGGGVNVEENGMFTMTGGSIEGCSATGDTTSSGGGVYNGGTFTMTGGSITGCSADAGGGGVTNGAGGTFTMSGSASITGCSATGSDSCGGGVQNGFGIIFTMEGSSRIENCEAEYGADLFNMGPFEISGSAAVGKTALVMVLADGDIFESDTYCNIAVNTSLSAFTGGVSNITFCMMDISTWGIVENTTVWVGQTVVKDGKDYAANFSLSSAYTGCGLKAGTGGQANDLVLAAKPPAYVEVSTWDELVTAASEWTDKDTMRTIVVMNDVVNGTAGLDYGGIPVTGNITIMPKNTGSASEIKIDGAGYSRLFYVDGTLTLAGNSSTVLNVTGGNSLYLYACGGGVQVNGGGNLMLAENAKITNCSTVEGGGAVWINNGMFTMTGGSITGCSAKTGGGVYVNSGTFTMTGGSITGCSATGDMDSSGGGVYVSSTSTFTMTGGSITGCSAQYGGGVDNSDTFTMTGGSITGCSATRYGGGVSNSMGMFTMEGSASITGCSATETGGGVRNVFGTFTMEGSSRIENCEAEYGADLFNMGSFEISGSAAVGKTALVMMPADGDIFESDTYCNIAVNTSLSAVTGGVSNITFCMMDISTWGIVENTTVWVGQTVVVNSTDTSRFKLSPLYAGSGLSLVSDGSSSLILSAGSPVPPVPPVVPGSGYHNLGADLWCAYDEERDTYTLITTETSASVGSLPASAYNVTFLGYRNEDVKIVEVQPGVNLTGGSGAFSVFTNAELRYFNDGSDPARDVFGAGRLIYPVNATNSSVILTNGHYTGRAITLETDWALAGQKVMIAAVPENGYAVYEWKLHRGEYKTGDLIIPAENYIERTSDPDYGSTVYLLTMPNSAVTVEPVLRDQASMLVTYVFIDADSYVLEIPADFNIKKQDLPVTDKMVNLTACDLLPDHVLNVNMTSEGGYTNLGLPGFSGNTFVMSNIRSPADKAGYTIGMKQIYDNKTSFSPITINGEIVLSTLGFDAEDLDDKIVAGVMKTELEFTLKGVKNQDALGKYKDKLTFTVEIES